MSVIVKGVDMPESCGTCFVGNRTICKNGCPLGVLPDKHGRLIDADELKNKNPLHMELDVPYVTEETVGEIIDDALTIVEAEDER